MVSVHDFLSRELLAACFFVMLFSSAVDQYPGEVEPEPLNFAYEIHTSEQEASYAKTKPIIRNTELFEAPQMETLFANQALGAEDLAVSQDEVAYVGLADGRLASFSKAANEFRNFSRTGRDLPECGTPDMEPTCGRPLGLVFAAARPFAKFLKRIPGAMTFAGDQVLLVADAYKGVLLFDANGKRTLLFSRVGEEQTNFLDGIAVVQETGEIYVTEASRRFQCNRVFLDFLEHKPSGYLLHFDPNTGRANVVVGDLGFPNGLTFDKDGSGLLIALTFQNKIVRFDLKTKQIKDFAFVPGEPDNISIEKVGAGENEHEVLMVGLVSLNEGYFYYIKQSVKIRKLLSLLPTWLTLFFVRRIGIFASVDLETGNILHVYEASQGQTPLVSGTRRFGDDIYLMSWRRPFISRISAALIE
ncbi:strictosidine conserved region [Plasmopara halstedii]|uniref:Strictosidine conserved region n=1 Tax=Plasmopara halstedii TaxID=4781 RepID=A0A0P1AAP7_PLAHL|nr:strictosidine conserved region [Plasmopara halstedii]CEG37310.1 strictosidine conserved region [Plasmopara halstedii]|eukprot:XP_024573679.1 strictosidine conserved region [Plasmopara halstedii]